MPKSPLRLPEGGLTRFGLDLSVSFATVTNMAQSSDSRRKAYLHAERRGESRYPSPQNGTYLKNLNIGDSTTFEKGWVIMFNESVNGALLQMSRSFNCGDILEVYWPQSTESRATTLYEVRWSQPLEARADCRGYEIGCRLLFSTEWIKTFTPSAPFVKPTRPGLTVFPAAARTHDLRDG